MCTHQRFKHTNTHKNYLIKRKTYGEIMFDFAVFQKQWYNAQEHTKTHDSNTLRKVVEFCLDEKMY